MQVNMEKFHRVRYLKGGASTVLRKASTLGDSFSKLVVNDGVGVFRYREDEESKILRVDLSVFSQGTRTW